MQVIGRGRRLTAGWLVQRERLAAGADLAVAPNNAAFAFAGARRVVIAVNALHYLYPSEEHLLGAFSLTWRAQIPVVRARVRRADLVVVPCNDMADRVAHHVESVASRLAVRPHPVTRVAVDRPTEPANPPLILVPVVPGPHKNLIPHLRLLVEAARRIGYPAEIRVTARPDQLPGDLRGQVTPIGVMAFARLAVLWSAASAVFFPSTLEAFGYPLAEARAYGVPVLAPGTRQAAEIAGGALRPYRPDRLDSLVDALLSTAEPVVADPEPFDRDAYFRWLFNPFARVTHIGPSSH